MNVAILSRRYIYTYTMISTSFIESLLIENNSKERLVRFQVQHSVSRISTAIASLDIRSDRGRLSVIQQTRGRWKYKAIRLKKPNYISQTW